MNTDDLGYCEYADCIYRAAWREDGIPICELHADFIGATPPGNECRTCGEDYPEFGDGWDGECPSCADRTNARAATLSIMEEYDTFETARRWCAGECGDCGVQEDGYCASWCAEQRCPADAFFAPPTCTPPIGPEFPAAYYGTVALAFREAFPEYDPANRDPVPPGGWDFS